MTIQTTETIGAGLGVPVRRLPEGEADAHFDWMARFVAIEQPKLQQQWCGLASLTGYYRHVSPRDT